MPEYEFGSRPSIVAPDHDAHDLWLEPRQLLRQAFEDGARAIQDLAERGLLDDVLVCTAGEFGRTPRINANAGRDHWPQAQSILFAGGGFKHGQIIGSTNAKAEFPTSRKVTVEDFCATIYHAMGLNIDDEVIDHSGRPVHLVPGGTVPREML